MYEEHAGNLMEAKAAVERRFNQQQLNNQLKHGAIVGAIVALSNSAVSNAMAYHCGEKSAQDAVMQVAKDAAVGGLTGGAIGAGMVGFERVIGIELGGMAVSGTFFAVEAGSQIWKWWTGEISGVQCAESVARTFTVRAAGAAGAVVAAGIVSFLNVTTPLGPLVWALPIVASALGYSGASHAADALFREASIKIHLWIMNKSKMQVLKDAYDFLNVNRYFPKPNYNFEKKINLKTKRKT